jgi:hypothetical protein
MGGLLAVGRRDHLEASNTHEKAHQRAYLRALMNVTETQSHTVTKCGTVRRRSRLFQSSIFTTALADSKTYENRESRQRRLECGASQK